jgi:hypothetical protein
MGIVVEWDDHAGPTFSREHFLCRKYLFNRVETNEVAPNVGWLIEKLLSVQSSLRCKRVSFRRTIVSTSDIFKDPKRLGGTIKTSPSKSFFDRVHEWRHQSNLVVCSIRWVPVASLKTQITREIDSVIKVEPRFTRTLFHSTSKPKWAPAIVQTRAERCSPLYARLSKFERLDRIHFKSCKTLYVERSVITKLVVRANPAGWICKRFPTWRVKSTSELTINIKLSPSKNWKFSSQFHK